MTRWFILHRLFVPLSDDSSGRKSQPISRHKFWHTTCSYRV